MSAGPVSRREFFRKALGFVAVPVAGAAALVMREESDGVDVWTVGGPPLSHEKLQDLALQLSEETTRSMMLYGGATVVHQHLPRPEVIRLLSTQG